MPQQTLRIDTIQSVYENGVHHCRPLFVREVSAIGDKTPSLHRRMLENVRQVLENDPLINHYRRRAMGDLELAPASVDVKPPRGVMWQNTVTLTFDVIRWRHGEGQLLAYIPVLDVEVIASREEEFDKRIEHEIRFALQRTRAGASLSDLMWLQRVEKLTLETLKLDYYMPTPRERASQKEQKDPLATVKKVCDPFPPEHATPAFHLDDIAARIAEAIGSRRPRSVLLIGQPGVGKTAAAQRLASGPARFDLGGKKFYSTSGARLVSGMTGFGEWQQRCQQLVEEARDNRLVLYMGELLELMETGKSEGNQQGIGEFLRPWFERGELLGILECTPEQLAVIERKTPDMLYAFQRIDMQEPSSETCRDILQQTAAHLRPQQQITPEAIAAVDNLHRRYAAYSSAPGRPLQFLRWLLDDAKTETAIEEADVVHAFSQQTGLPLKLLDPAAPLDLEEVQQWFSNRLIGQQEAIRLVVDLLATIKAGITQPGRPLASLLFIGPTGVGKTEMAKALAEFFYHDPQRMIRFDMSEYADPSAVGRLIGGEGRQEGLLTARVREEPFGVVLLDEFEKAHPRLHDVLLQVLGEGRLTDAAGRLADFTNSVIIMTSNLGVESQRRSVGFQTGAEETTRVRDHFVNEVRKFVRPEFFNRIDRIAPFDPLSLPMLTAVARRELQLIEKRDGVQYRDLRLQLAGELPQRLAEKSYDPRYGARPLKRTIERELLAPLATSLNEYAAQTAVKADVTWRDGGVHVVTSGLDGEAEHGASIEDFSVLRVTEGIANWRRLATRLLNCGAAGNIKNEVYRLERSLENQRKRREKRKRRRRAGEPEENVTAEEISQLQRITDCKKMFGVIEQAYAQALELEEKHLVALYAGEPIDADEVRLRALHIGEMIDDATMQLYTWSMQAAAEATICIYSENRSLLPWMAKSYYSIAMRRQFRPVEVYALRSMTDDQRQQLMDSDDANHLDRRLQDGSIPMGLKLDWTALDVKHAATLLTAKPVNDTEKFLAGKPGAIGIAITCKGQLALPLFSNDEGVHAAKMVEGTAGCLTQVTSLPLSLAPVPERIDRRGTISTRSARRNYDLTKRSIRDGVIPGERRWSGDGFSEIHEKFLSRSLLETAREELFISPEPQGDTETPDSDVFVIN